MGPTANHISWKSLIPQWGQPSQRQHVRVPCRVQIPIPYGALDTNITFARIAEEGQVQNVYGYNSSPYFNQVKDNWENFYVLGMCIEWCPSNAVGTQNAQN